MADVKINHGWEKLKMHIYFWITEYGKEFINIFFYIRGQNRSIKIAYKKRVCIS